MSLEDQLYPLLSTYERFPPAAKRFIGGAYRILPEFIRRGKNYSYFNGIFQQGERWTREQIWEYQFKQLRRTLNNANSYCPFYTERFAEAGFLPYKFKSPEDLRLCPTTTKRDLIDHLAQMTSTNLPGSAR